MFHECFSVLSNNLVQVRSGPEYQLVVGQTVYLDLDPRGWRLFDATGQALAHHLEAPNREPQLPEL